MQSSEALGSLFGHVAGILHRQADQVLQERLGIGMSQFNIMANLEKRPQAKQRALADSLGQTEASISRQVSLLRERGLVAVRVDPAERRRRLAMLTPRGAKILLAASEVLEQFYSQLFGGLAAGDQARLQTLLDALHQQACAPDKRLACGIPTTRGAQVPSKS